MLGNDWVIKAEVRIEAIRKAAENELQVLKHDFAHWQGDDARRGMIMRFATILFVPVVSLYTMRVHMHDPMWWEQYAPGAGKGLADAGRTAFDKGIKSKLILDLVGNLEHSFRLILNQLDPANKASKFGSIYRRLFGASNPLLDSAPSEWEPTLELLRLMRNTVHNSWAHFPDNGENTHVIFNGKRYEFVVGKTLDFVSWDLLGEIADSVLKIAIGVVRDRNVVHLASIRDFGLEQTSSSQQRNGAQPTRECG
jgi:hypothetical protein